MCLDNFSSQVVERHNKPEVEVRLVEGMSCGLESSFVDTTYGANDLCIFLQVSFAFVANRQFPYVGK
jgi:hypothetical protein